MKEDINVFSVLKIRIHIFSSDTENLENSNSILKRSVKWNVSCNLKSNTTTTIKSLLLCQEITTLIILSSEHRGKKKNQQFNLSLETQKPKIEMLYHPSIFDVYDEALGTEPTGHSFL